MRSTAFHCPECRCLTSTPTTEVKVRPGKRPIAELLCGCCGTRVHVEILPELSLMLLLGGAEVVYPITEAEIERFVDALAANDLIAPQAM